MENFIKVGSSDNLVAPWQTFLSSQGFQVNATGSFDSQTELATKQFQKKFNLNPHGMAGKKTFRVAAKLGFDWVDSPVIKADFPQKPDFPPVDNDQKQKMFGPLQFRVPKNPKGPEDIEITNDWEDQNLQTIKIPQLAGVPIGSMDSKTKSSGKVRFHKKAVAQLKALWLAWEEAELVDRIISYDGTFVPRFIRGSTDTLSNHSFGTAFDINSGTNEYQKKPAAFGETGCLYELVPLANEFGFFWGGHFSHPWEDGMHFEVAKIIEVNDNISTISTTLKGEKAELTGANNVVISSDAQLTEIKAAISALETEINGITLSLNTRLSDLKNAIATLETSVTGTTLLPTNRQGSTGGEGTTSSSKKEKTASGSPELPEGWKLYRVLPDTEVKRWNHKPRTLIKGWRQPFSETSQVVPLTRDKKSVEQTGFTVLDDRWEAMFKQINSLSKDRNVNKKRFDWVTANDTAWFNHAPRDRSSGWKDGIESLAMGSAPGLWDNVLACRDVGGVWLEVLTLRPDASTEGISREATPWFVHRFTLVGYKKKDNNRPYWGDPKHGECYAVLVTKWPVFIRKDWVEAIK